MQICGVVIVARNRYMLISWMVNTWSHELHNWIITWFYTLELKCIVWQCASYFWSLNGVLKFCKFCNVFVICRKVRAVLMTKILWFWLFSVLSHQSWIKNFLSVIGQDIKSWFQSAMISPGLHERQVCSFDRDQISCKLHHLYERRVCSFDRNQMVQIQFAFYVERACIL